MKTNRFRLTAAAALLCAALAGPAFAASKTGVEFLRYVPGAEPFAAQTLYGREAVSSSGSSAQSSAAPTFGSYSTGYAQLQGISGAAVCTVGTNPTASQANGVRVEVGQSAALRISTGQKVACIEASDAPAGVTATVSGGATAANQATANASLSSIATSVTGVATAANQAATNVLLSAATPAGENHIGKVGGTTVAVTVAPTVTAASAYTSGNTLGSLLTFTNAARVAAGSGIIQNVSIDFKSAQTAPVDLLLFIASPSGSTVTDKTAVAVAVGDFDKQLAPIHITDCTNTGTTSVCSATALGIAFALPAGRDLYAIAVTRGTPTFTATTDVSVRLTVLQD